MQQHHSKQMSLRVLYVNTCKILLLLFCIWTSYILLIVYLVLILKFNTFPLRLHDVKHVLNHKTLSRKHRKNMTSFLNYLTATLRALLHDAAQMWKTNHLMHGDLGINTSTTVARRGQRRLTSLCAEIGLRVSWNCYNTSTWLRNKCEQLENMESIMSWVHYPASKCALSA